MLTAIAVLSWLVVVASSLAVVTLAILLVWELLDRLRKPQIRYCLCSRCVLIQSDHMDIEGTRHSVERCSPLVESLP